MNTITFRLVQIFIVLVILAIAVVGILAFFHYNSAAQVDSARVDVVMLRLQSSAKVYYGRLGYYDGVCKDIGLPEGYACRDSATTFVIYAKLPDDTYYCADSDGYLGNVPVIWSYQKWCTR